MALQLQVTNSILGNRFSDFPVKNVVKGLFYGGVTVGLPWEKGCPTVPIESKNRRVFVSDMQSVQKLKLYHDFLQLLERNHYSVDMRPVKAEIL